MEPRVRAAMADLDAGTPVFLVRPLVRFVEESDAVFRRRTALTVIAGFALAALALAAVGVYGAVALMVARRTREIGIRQALGATRGQVLLGTLRRGLAPAAIGIGLGVGASLAAAPTLRSLVFGIGATDGLSLAGAVVFLFVVALVAACVPARRVLRIDPVRALRD
jgi:ABC-type antimicrobial peptide transport system permease subunit